MTTFRLKQIGLALCLMASLLTASPAACICSHHDETETVEVDCHSHHGSAEPEASNANSVDESCICAVEQPLPRLASKSENTDFRSQNDGLRTEQIIPDLQYVAVNSFRSLPAEFTSRRSYSSTLRLLLPARAPPRL